MKFFKHFSPEQVNWISHLEVWPSRMSHDWESKRLKIFERYHPWAKSIAFSVKYRFNVANADSLDYEQYSSIGLLESIDRYDPTFGKPFKGYARKRIQGAIINDVYKYSESTSFSNYEYTRSESVHSSLVNNSEESNNSLDALVNSIVDLAIGCITEDVSSSDKRVGSSNLDEGEYYSFGCRVLKCMDRLPSKQRAVLDHHYCGLVTFKEISENLNLSKGRVSQIHAEALRNLRIMLKI